MAAGVFACAGGSALAAVSGHQRVNRGALTETAPLTSVPFTSTVTTSTDTTTTATSTTTTTTTSTPPELRVCLGSARRVMARRLGVSAASIRTHQLLATNGMQQCNYVIARARRGGPRAKVVLTVNVDNGPQAHWRLMRKVVEASQLFGPPPKNWRPPVGVSGLGPYASWFPALDQLMANNIGGRYILTVGVIWHHTTKAQKVAITRATIAVYRHIRRLSTLPA